MKHGHHVRHSPHHRTGLSPGPFPIANVMPAPPPPTPPAPPAPPPDKP